MSDVTTLDRGIGAGLEIGEAAMCLLTHVTYCRDMYARNETCSMPHAHKISFERKRRILEETDRILMWFVENSLDME